MIEKRKKTNYDSLCFAGRNKDMQPTGGIYLVGNDRSIMGDMAFALEHLRAGNINATNEKAAYRSLLAEMAPYPYNYILFFDVEPETAHHRVTKMRKNPSELNMPLDYLEKLRRAYYFLLREHALAQRIRLVYLYNEPFVEVPQVLDRMLLAPSVEQTAEFFERDGMQLPDEASAEQVADCFAKLRALTGAYYDAARGSNGGSTIGLKASGDLIKPPSPVPAAAATQ